MNGFIQSLLSLGAIAISSFVVALSGAMMPGPVLTVTINQSFRRGFIAGPLIILGHAILEVVLILLLLAGLGPFLQQEIIIIIISLAGSIVLLFMGIDLFRSLPSWKLDTQKTETSAGHPLIQGILLSLTNPYWIIWWLTIGLGYVLLAWKSGLPGVLAFFLGHIAGDLLWYSFISFTVSKGRKIIPDIVFRIVLAVCALVLLFFAVLFIFRGINGILALL